MYIRQTSYVGTPWPKGKGAGRTASSASSTREVAHALGTLALLLTPIVCAAEKFVHFGSQPDGSQIYVQEAPATVRKDGRLQGWFRTVPKAPAPVTDAFGFERRYRDMLGLNVADCFNRRMGTAVMTYRDEKGNVVAQFDAAAGAIEYREVKAGTLGESMFTWLCAPRPRSATPPSAAGAPSPFK
jgi:hypothetical protein